MILKKINTDVVQIKNVKQAKQKINDSIDEFINDCKMKPNLWGQLYLYFEKHEEIYDIDDICSEDDSVDEDSIYGELMSEINERELLCSVFVRFGCPNIDTIDNYSFIYSGVSSIYLKNYVECSRETNGKIEYNDKSMFDKGIIGEPYEVTKWINRNQNFEYTSDLVERFNSFLCPNNITGPSPSVVDDEWGECHLFIYNKKFFAKIFDKVRYKNDYFFFILDSGELVIATPVSMKHDSFEDKFYKDCLKRANNYEINGFFLREFNYKNKDLIFACYADTSIIGSLKFQILNQVKEEDVMHLLYKTNILTFMHILEEFSDAVAGNYDR